MPKGKHLKPSKREMKIRDLKTNLRLKQMAIDEMQKALVDLAEKVKELRSTNRDLKLLLEFYKRTEGSAYND